MSVKTARNRIQHTKVETRIDSPMTDGSSLVTAAGRSLSRCDADAVRRS